MRILERTKEFVLVDGLLRFKDTPVKIPSLTGPEKIFVRIVQTEGPVVSFESLYGGLAREGFSIASHSKLLGESPIVQKVESGLYTLVGMPYDAVDIERAKHDLTRVSANYTMKPRSDGIMEFEVNVGNMTIYSGVLSCGPAVQMQGIWKTIVDGTQEGELLVKGHFIQKLESARDRLGLVPGDRIRIDFNTWTREATIRKVVIDEKA